MQRIQVLCDQITGKTEAARDLYPPDQFYEIEAEAHRMLSSVDELLTAALESAPRKHERSVSVRGRGLGHAEGSVIRGGGA